MHGFHKSSIVFSKTYLPLFPQGTWRSVSRSLVSQKEKSPFISSKFLISEGFWGTMESWSWYLFEQMVGCFLGFLISNFLGFKVSKFRWSHITNKQFHVFLEDVDPILKMSKISWNESSSVVGDRAFKQNISEAQQFNTYENNVSQKRTDFSWNILISGVSKDE